MVHVATPKPNLGAALGQGLGQGVSQGMDEMRQTSSLRKALANAEKIYSDPNLNPQQKQSGLLSALAPHPEIAKQYLGQFNQQQQMQQQQQALRAIERQRGMPEGSLAGLEGNENVAASITKPQNAPGGTTSQPVPPEISQKANEILNSNQNANADELKMKLDEAGIPPIFSNGFVENRRRQDESKASIKENRSSEARKQSAPLKEEIIEKANIARESIKNKSHLIDLINKGNIDDPTYATFLESLPGNYGKRFLSNDTVEYKSGLVDEFKDLRNIFKGATRVKEVELYENKLADLYLNDSQKKAILSSRIDASKADLIKEEAAQEIEEEFPDISALQFNKKVNELSSKKMNNLFDSIWDQQKTVLDQAEKRKNIPLDINDPEDYKLMNQMFLEAGGDAKKAMDLAKKKGYKIKE